MKKVISITDISDPLKGHRQFFDMSKQTFKQVFIPQEPYSTLVYQNICVTDLRYGEASTMLTLARQPDILGFDELENAGKEHQFITQGLASLHQLKDLEQGRDKTYLFHTLHHAINELQHSKYSSLRIIASTDWSENSFLNFHNPKTLTLLQSNPDSIYNLIQSTYPLEPIPKDKKVELIILFQSSDIEEDRRFTILVEKLKPFYESRGARVHIVNNLKNIIWSF